MDCEDNLWKELSVDNVSAVLLYCAPSLVEVADTQAYASITSMSADQKLTCDR